MPRDALAHSWHRAVGRALPLVCLHGSLCDRSFFDPLDGVLPGYRALCIDLPGHGGSGRAAEPANAGAPPRLEDMAAAVFTLLVSLEVTKKPWVIAGHSLGGAVALLVIELIATSSGDHQLPRVFVSFEGNATPACCAADGLARRVAALQQPPSVEEVLQMVSTTPVWLEAASKIGDSLGLLAHQIWISLVEWCDGRKMHGATLEEMQQRVPLRYVYGSTSGKYHASNRAAHDRHPSAAAIGVAGAGHFMLSEDPSGTLAALTQLLGDLAGEGEEAHLLTAEVPITDKDVRVEPCS